MHIYSTCMFKLHLIEYFDYVYYILQITENFNVISIHHQHHLYKKRPYYNLSFYSQLQVLWLE